MTKLARIFDTLDLYSEGDALLTAEEIAQRLNVSRPTAFRYVRELTEAGFLANFAGRYSLGARIITLDYKIRLSDPVLKASVSAMQKLSADTACTSIMCRLYNDELIHVHLERGTEEVNVSFGRGRSLPLFRGAPSKVMLANLTNQRLRRLFDQNASDTDLLAIGKDWDQFKTYFQGIRDAGHYFSNQEVEKGTLGLSAAISVPGEDALGVISLVFSVERFALINLEGFATTLKACAAEISSNLTQLVELPVVSQELSRLPNP